MKKMLPHKAQANPKGESMPSKMGKSIDSSVMTPKKTGLSAEHKNTKSMPNKMLPHKEEVPVAGKPCGKGMSKKGY